MSYACGQLLFLDLTDQYQVNLVLGAKTADIILALFFNINNVCEFQK